MWCAGDPDAWQGEIPPEWEPELCEHPMYRMAVSEPHVEPWHQFTRPPDGTLHTFWYEDWFAVPKKRCWVSDR